MRDEEKLQHFGIKGYDVFTRHLVYTNFNNLYVLPTYHLMLHGVVRGYWKRALEARYGVLSADDRYVMTERGGGFVPTDDHSKYADVCRHNKTFKLSEWLSWTDC